MSAAIDPGYCEHGMTIGAKCRRCPEGVALADPIGLYRPTDPHTSRAAAQSVAASLSGMQTRVVATFYARGRLTHEGLCRTVIGSDRSAGRTPPTEQAIRTACARLVKAGIVRNSGDRERTARGRLAVLWEVTPREPGA